MIVAVYLYSSAINPGGTVNVERYQYCRRLSNRAFAREVGKAACFVFRYVFRFVLERNL